MVSKKGRETAQARARPSQEPARSESQRAARSPPLINSSWPFLTSCANLAWVALFCWIHQRSKKPVSTSGQRGARARLSMGRGRRRARRQHEHCLAEGRTDEFAVGVLLQAHVDRVDDVVDLGGKVLVHSHKPARVVAGRRGEEVWDDTVRRGKRQWASFGAVSAEQQRRRRRVDVLC